MGAFMASLVGGYAQTLIKKHKEDRDREERMARDEISALGLVLNNPAASADQMKAAGHRIEEITSEYGGKGGKKGGFSIANLIGRFSDTQQPKQQSQPGSTPAATPSAAPSVSLGAPPARPGVTGATQPAQGSPTAQASPSVSLGQPPTRTAAQPANDPNDPWNFPHTAADAQFTKQKELLGIQHGYRAEEQAATEKQREDFEQERDAQQEKMQNMRDQAASDRAAFTAQMTNLRQQHQEAFQESMEGLREHAATMRQAQSAGMTDARAMRTVLSSSLNNTLSNLRAQQMKTAQGLQAAQKSLAGKSWYSFGKANINEQIKETQDAYNGTRAAITYIEGQRGAILSGKVDMDKVVDHANQIMLLGGADPSGLSLTPK